MCDITIRIILIGIYRRSDGSFRTRAMNKWTKRDLL